MVKDEARVSFGAELDHDTVSDTHDECVIFWRARAGKLQYPSTHLFTQLDEIGVQAEARMTAERKVHVVNFLVLRLPEFQTAAVSRSVFREQPEKHLDVF